MNLIAMAAFGAAAVVFGPAFLVQAAVGYVVGSGCGAYARNKMHKLHREICRRTGDKASDMDELGDYAMKASQVGGVICPVIPLVSVGVGLVCDHRAEKLKNLPERQVREDRPMIGPGRSIAKGVRL